MQTAVMGILSSDREARGIKENKVSVPGEGRTDVPRQWKSHMLGSSTNSSPAEARVSTCMGMTMQASSTRPELVVPDPAAGSAKHDFRRCASAEGTKFCGRASVVAVSMMIYRIDTAFTWRLRSQQDSFNSLVCIRRFFSLLLVLFALWHRMLR